MQVFDKAVQQIAYCTDSIERTALQHHQLFGSGPFFLMENIENTVQYRGEETVFRHHAAFGQWGDMQVELMQPLDEGPSVIHDLYPDVMKKRGIHHVCIFTSDFHSFVEKAQSDGYSLAIRAYLEVLDVNACMLDTVETYGHFIEVFEETPAVLGFYDHIKQAALDFDGNNILRPFN